MYLNAVLLTFARCSGMTLTPFSTLSMCTSFASARSRESGDVLMFLPYGSLWDLHPIGGRRATIKAHPATPHHSRPYRKGISRRMESFIVEKMFPCPSLSIED